MPRTSGDVQPGERLEDPDAERFRRRRCSGDRLRYLVGVAALHSRGVVGRDGEVPRAVGQCRRRCCLEPVTQPGERTTNSAGYFTL